MAEKGQNLALSMLKAKPATKKCPAAGSGGHDKYEL